MKEKKERQLTVNDSANIVEYIALIQEEIDTVKGKQKIINKTIAVLPFVNMSASAENEYFSDGITEEIINALSKVNNLKVTSRTSSFYFKNKNKQYETYRNINNSCNRSSYRFSWL